MPFTVEGRPTWLKGHSDEIFENLTETSCVRGPGQAGYLVNYPPLYYALGAIPYRIAYDASFLDRIFAVRLLVARCSRR